MTAKSYYRDARRCKPRSIFLGVVGGWTGVPDFELPFLPTRRYSCKAIHPKKWICLTLFRR